MPQGSARSAPAQAFPVGLTGTIALIAGAGAAISEPRRGKKKGGSDSAAIREREWGNGKFGPLNDGAPGGSPPKRESLTWGIRQLV